MRFLKKGIFCLLLFFVVLIKPVFAQNFDETPEHKRMWKIFGRKKHRDAFNPNVKNGKATHEVSKELAKEDKKTLRRANREIKKQKRKNKRKLHMK
ncbi:MAG: hypothetical protein ACYDEC_02690 [Bacteroidia bacterium]